MKRILFFMTLYLLITPAYAYQNYHLYFDLPDNTTIYLYNLNDLNQNQYLKRDTQTIESYILAFNINYQQISHNKMFKDLPQGNYFCIFENEQYHIESLSIQLNQDFLMSPKTRKKEDQVYDLNVKKQWVGQQLDEITISLYENNHCIQTVKLTSDHQYSYCFKDLNDLNKYTVIEHINDHYYYTITRNNQEMIITNYQKDLQALPQTGMPLIIIPCLVIIGVVMIIVGVKHE